MLRWVFILLISINSLYSQVQFQVPGITVSPSNTIDLPVTIQTNGNVLGSLEFALKIIYFHPHFQNFHPSSLA